MASADVPDRSKLEAELQRLRDAHQALDDEIANYDARKWLSPAEEKARKKAQKLKLAHKDEMARIERSLIE